MLHRNEINKRVEAIAAKVHEHIEPSNVKYSDCNVWYESSCWVIEKGANILSTLGVIYLMRFYAKKIEGAKDGFLISQDAKQAAEEALEIAAIMRATI